MYCRSGAKATRRHQQGQSGSEPGQRDGTGPGTWWEIFPSQDQAPRSIIAAWRNRSTGGKETRMLDGKICACHPAAHPPTSASAMRTFPSRLIRWAMYLVLLPSTFQLGKESGGEKNAAGRACTCSFANARAGLGSRKQSPDSASIK